MRHRRAASTAAAGLRHSSCARPPACLASRRKRRCAPGSRWKSSAHCSRSSSMTTSPAMGRTTTVSPPRPSTGPPRAAMTGNNHHPSRRCSLLTARLLVLADLPHVVRRHDPHIRLVAELLPARRRRRRAWVEQQHNAQSRARPLLTERAIPMNAREPALIRPRSRDVGSPSSAAPATTRPSPPVPPVQARRLLAHWPTTCSTSPPSGHTRQGHRQGIGRGRADDGRAPGHRGRVASGLAEWLAAR